ncbi:Transmembrane receptor [Macleaya cordata]|uniref:Transmembrane receptor n=1 Tax=Macleaya cordata TaxID=56857 RepID=A0A200PVS5_MACCD|nr:Transmembrane receptor [Macleaya cordata]
MGTLNSFITLYDYHHHPILKLFGILCIISSIPVSVSEIRDTRISDDSRPMILFEQFGFAQDGHVSISIKDLSWRSKHFQDIQLELDPSSMGFFLVRESSYSLILNESEYTDNFCVVSSHYVKLIFKFKKFVESSTYNGSITVKDPGEYSLVFGNCQPEFEISMTVHTEMYNIVYGTTKDFLPAGQTPLPKLYFIFFVIYSGFFAVWVYICIKQRLVVDKIHLIMAALLVFKALKMICAAEEKLYVRRTGTSHGWDIAFYIFGFFKGIMLFTVIVLIGTGWSFLKPYLQEREKKVLMTVIPLQVLENIASAVIGETGPATNKDWLTWNQIFLLIDIVCCFAVFFPIIWSIRNLREASKTDGKAAKNLEKLTLFKQFYVVVVEYIYFTRVVVFVLGGIIVYRFQWVINAAVEGASLAFYTFIFYNFQPIQKNPYLAIDDDEGHEQEAAAAQMLEEDDSFEL